MNEEKPSLPHGWLVKQSRSYPDRVYYFNINTGVTTWNMPDLVNMDMGPMKPNTISTRTCSLEPSDFKGTERDDLTNEPVFSQFQEQLCRNSAVQDKLISEPKTPKQDFFSDDSDDECSYLELSKIKEENNRRKEQELPIVKIKKEKTVKPCELSRISDNQKGTPTNMTKGESSVLHRHDKGHQTSHSKGDDKHKQNLKDRSHISKVLSQIRKSVEKNPNPKINKTVSKKKHSKTVLDCDSKVHPLSRKEGKKSPYKKQNAPKPSTLQEKSLPLKDQKGIAKISTPKNEDKSSHIKSKAEKERDLSKSCEKLSTPGGQGIWSRKRKINVEKDDTTVKHSRNDQSDLSLKIEVKNTGESRKVVVTSEQKLLSTDSCDNILDLNAPNTPAIREKLSMSQSVCNDSTRKADILKSAKGNTLHNRSEDVRRVVSSDSESNTNNSGLTTRHAPNKHTTGKIGRIQAWVDDISQPSVLQPVQSSVTSLDQQPHHELQERHQNEAEFCDMEVDEDEFETDKMIVDLQEVRGELRLFPDQVEFRIYVSSKPVRDVTSLSEVPKQHLLTQTLYLIVDTSSLMTHLKMLADIRDDQIEGFGLPALVIPWVVLQELDSLKDNKSSKSFCHSSQTMASKAVKYLNICFSRKHPRVIGQTPKQSREVIDDLKIECNDDHVLQCCIQFKSLFARSVVVMVSEDLNLCTKARVCGIEAGSVKTLHDILSELSQPPDPLNSSLSADHPEEILKANLQRPSETVNDITSIMSIAASPCSQLLPVKAPAKKFTRGQLDRLVVSIKGEIKATLGPILEKEMKEAFGDIWKTVVYRKPPWAALDVMESIKKHWMAVFGMIIQRSTSVVVHDIVNRLQMNKVDRLELPEIEELINDLLTLLRALKQHSNYSGRVDKSIMKLKTMLQDLENGNIILISPTSSQSSLIMKTSRDLPCTQQTTSQLPKSSSIPMSTTPQATSHLRSIPPKSSSSRLTTSATTSTSQQMNKKESSNTTSVGIATHTNDEFTSIHSCFDIVWKNIYQTCLAVEDGLRENANAQCIGLLKHLLGLIKDLRFTYAMCLSISPLELYNNKQQFDQLVLQLNTFFHRLNCQTVEIREVHTDALLAFFKCTDNRPLLAVGLNQLDTAIKNLQELDKHFASS